MSENDKLKEIFLKAKSDYFFLCKEILGYKDLRVVPHKELCWTLEKKDRRKKLVLMPRGSFKSSVVTVGYAVRSIIKNPNIRILISGETQRNSIKYVQEIKSHFDSNNKFKAIFGDWSQGAPTWRDNEFTVGKRTKFPKEPTVMAASLEKQAVTGLHFDLIILDDPVSSLNVNHPEQIQKTIDHYRLLLSVLDPGDDKQVIVVGTRYHFGDLYGWIMDSDSGERDQFDIFLRQAIDKDGKLLLPDRLTKEFLDEQRKTQSEYIFACQYMNQPISDANTTFRQEQVQFYSEPPKNLYVFMSIDPAISTKDRSDFSAIIVNGVDSDQNWWILEAIEFKMDPSTLVDEIFKLVQKYNKYDMDGVIKCLAMEKYVIEKVLKITLAMEMERRDVFFPIQEVPTNNRESKEARIRALQPKFEQKKIFIHKDHASLYHQICYHPQLKHDDLLDALKTQLQIVFAPAPQQTDESDKYKHLSANERRVWENVDKAIRKRVRRTKCLNI